MFIFINSIKIHGQIEELSKVCLVVKINMSISVSVTIFAKRNATPSIYNILASREATNFFLKTY